MFAGSWTHDGLYTLFFLHFIGMRALQAPVERGC